MTDKEKVIKGLEHCIEKLDTVVNKTHGFNCIDCPYFRKCDRSGYLIGLPLMRNALALLKAQDSKLMSEVELREIQAETPVWIEVPFEGCDIGHWALISYQHYNYPGVRRSFDDGALDGMGVKWRCWTSRPDEKRRSETPWKSVK